MTIHHTDDRDTLNRTATYDGRRHVLHLWESRFERTPRSCSSYEEAKALVEATGIPQKLHMLLRPVYHR